MAEKPGLRGFEGTELTLGLEKEKRMLQMENSENSFGCPGHRRGGGHTTGAPVVRALATPSPCPGTDQSWF